MYFNDRKEAGRILAERLQRFRGKNTVVLALPGGSVVVGSEVAKALDAPFGIVFVRKIAHPTERVYAIGAIAEGGEVVYESAEINNFSDSWRRDAENAARMSLMYRRNFIPQKDTVIQVSGTKQQYWSAKESQRALRRKPQRIHCTGNSRIESL
jgi:predicted phosphoribosyltransferase